MLDNTTKQKIDSLRNLLVGKVPDPKSQVEQITIALFYKFMWDRDKEIKDLGGNATFFVGEFEKYSWENLFAPDLGGSECIKLYSEAIEEMENNPNIPSIFRDIFKRAFLPYNDPYTLRLFLKEVNDFHYSNSEKLGDGFEYLLSILGTQGDAGQFRTPRHIIDFITEVVNPQKGDRICDPACGTAGFIISAYKHILKTNTKESLGDLLTPEDKKRLGNNLVGLDIDPMMVKLALANMYLHGLNEPHIYEYDSLTSEERWDDMFDVVLANPPFMTPSGGIRPHKRFAVNANKAEVLFTSYINTHLSNTGRAGIVVPEGIIFQSANAYKELRKQLIESSLIGVISLPAGVFNPYSPVKTSILILDKQLNKKTDKIFFVKVENDGFDLGKQRREIDKNNLPVISKAIKEYCNNITTGIIEDHIDLNYVLKEEILNSSDLGLTYDRYSSEAQTNSSFEIVELRELVELLDNKRKPISKNNRISGDYPYYGASGVVDHIDDYIFNEKLVLVGEDGAKWGKGDKTAFIINGKTWVNNHAHVLRPNRNLIEDKLLVELLNYQDLTRFITGVTVPKLNQKNLLSIKIPKPPLETQKEIVRELEQYQKVIDGAKQVVDNYKPHFDIDESWERIKLGELYSKNLSSVRVPITKSKRKTGKYPYYGASGIVDYVEDYLFNEKILLISEDGANLISRNTPIAFSVEGKVWVNNHAHVIKFDNYITQLYVENYINMIDISKYVTGSAQPKLNQQNLNTIQIALPNIEEQTFIVNQIQEERKIVEGNKQLIEIYSKKIEDRINKIWEE